MLELHPVCNLFIVTGRLNPRHPRWNLVTNNLLMCVFLNFLWLEAIAEVKGNQTDDTKDDAGMMATIVDQALFSWMAAVVAAPIISGLAQLFYTEKSTLRQKLRKAPYSFKNLIYYDHENKFNHLQFWRQLINNIFTLSICYYIWNVGNDSQDNAFLIAIYVNSAITYL